MFSLCVCVLYTYTYIIHIYLCLCVFTCVCNSVRIYISIFVCPFESPPPRTQRLHRTSRIVCVCLCTHAYTTPHTRLPHPLSAHARKTSSVKLDTHSRALSVRMMYVCSAYCKLDGVVETRAPLSSRARAGKRSPLHTHVYMYVYTITECRAVARERVRERLFISVFSPCRGNASTCREKGRGYVHIGVQRCSGEEFYGRRAYATSTIECERELVGDVILLVRFNFTRYCVICARQ